MKLHCFCLVSASRPVGLVLTRSQDKVIEAGGSRPKRKGWPGAAAALQSRPRTIASRKATSSQDRRRRAAIRSPVCDGRSRSLSRTLNPESRPSALVPRPSPLVARPSSPFPHRWQREMQRGAPARIVGGPQLPVVRRDDAATHR
jgi:hypothetical protein